MTISINGSEGLSLTGQFNSASTFGFKNRIINGAMVIDQRNAGASLTPSDTQYTLDRWQARLSASSKFSVQQNAGSVTPPSGFSNYLGITSLSAYSVSSTDFFAIGQNIEGFNSADFGWGTANAVPVTLSFWVRSSLTGTFGGSIYTVTGIPSYAFSYTINSANTWEYKTLTVPAQTAGSWSTTNGFGPAVTFSLGAGSSVSGTANTWNTGTLYRSVTGAQSVVGTNGATWYITGVQLEKGSTATSFDYRPYGTELALCQRYFEIVGSGTSSILVGGYGGAEIDVFFKFSTQKRAAATMTLVGTWSTSNVSAQGFAGLAIDGFSYTLTPSSATRTYIYNNNSGAYFTASAEL